MNKIKYLNIDHVRHLLSFAETSSLIPTLLPGGEGLFSPLPPGEGSGVRERFCKTAKNVNSNDVRRKLLITGAALPALAWTSAARAQPKPPIVIGWLHADSRESGAHYLAAFKEGLAALGWKEGSQFVLEERWADGQKARLPALAEELAAKKLTLIVAAPSYAVRPMAKAAPATPIVQASGGDLVEMGLAESLARPGGMITGRTNLQADVSAKYLEFLLNAVPKVKRVGVLDGPLPAALTRPNPADSPRRIALGRAAARYAVELRFTEITTPDEVEPAMARLAKQGVQALVVLQESVLRVERQRVMKLAQANRWPVVSGVIEFAEAGALISYGADVLANYRRAAYYVDRILKGTKPADLPIEQPTKFEFVLNLKSANALGLTIPPPVMVQATRVIE
jgi:putative tryptophan/tyrosine transport system substrate-binding protein